MELSALQVPRLTNSNDNALDLTFANVLSSMSLSPKLLAPFSTLWRNNLLPILCPLVILPKTLKPRFLGNRDLLSSLNDSQTHIRAIVTLD